MGTKWLKQTVLGVVVVILAAATGCSTLHFGGEGIPTGAAIGATAGYLINGRTGAYVGAAAGGLIGYWAGQAQPKPEGGLERNLFLDVKGKYAERASFDALTARINGVSNCVAKGLGEKYCRRLYKLEVER